MTFLKVLEATKRWRMGPLGLGKKFSMCPNFYATDIQSLTGKFFGAMILQFSRTFLSLSRT